MPVNRKSRKKRNTVYRVKKGAQGAATHFLTAFAIFMTVLLITLFFILYQWKNVAIRTHLDQIATLEAEILSLNSENNQLETKRNELLMQIPEISKNRLDMVTPVKSQPKLQIEKKKLNYYEKKDRKIQSN